MFRRFIPICNSITKNPGVFESTSRSYHKKVIDHYENPRNVGSMDKKNINVGTGLVGAPACFHGDTLISTADGRRSVKLIDLYESNEKIPVWSFNIVEKKYEVKWGMPIKTGKSKMVKLTFDDGGTVTCTKDHKFLTKPNYNYVENDKLGGSSIVPFKRATTRRGCWVIRNSEKREEYKSVYSFYRKEHVKKNGLPVPRTRSCSWNVSVLKCKDYNHKIVARESLEEEFYCYTLQVEENNNYVVMTTVGKNIQNGICVKNCGDVMKLQIEVDPETGIIINAVFKTFGCLAGNTKIATPKGYVRIKSLSVGDIVYAWNGKDIVENEIEEINIKLVNYKKLLRFEFEGSCHFKFICSCDHIWWLASDKPIEAENLKIGDELIHITENQRFSPTLLAENGSKVINKINIIDKKQLKGLEIDNDNVKLYDIRLKEGANVFFCWRVGTHNCGSAIAASSYSTELIKGKKIGESLEVTNKKIAAHLSLPPVKLHCSMLAEDAIKAAVYDYRKKQEQPIGIHFLKK